MISVIRLTFWSLPLIWAAIAILAAAVVALYAILLGKRRKMYTPSEVSEMLRMQEEALAEERQEKIDNPQTQE